MEFEKYLKCSECGEIFTPENLHTKVVSGYYESDLGVYSQFDSHTYYYDEISCCPFCDSENYEEGYMCEECGEFIEHFEDEINGICIECVGKYTEEEYNTKYPQS